jgi:hypothetical protein
MNPEKFVDRPLIFETISNGREVVVVLNVGQAAWLEPAEAETIVELARTDSTSDLSPLLRYVVQLILLVLQTSAIGYILNDGRDTQRLPGLPGRRQILRLFGGVQ